MTPPQDTMPAAADLCQPTPAPRAAFVAAMRRVPGAVAIVATGEAGMRRGLAATAWTSLTADPPTVLACVNRNASAHAAILTNRRFSINLVPTGPREVVAIFSAQRGLDGDDRFLAGAWSVSGSGQPLLNDAIVSFDCNLVGDHSQGTHSIMVGEVVGLHAATTGDALLYLDGAFASAGSLAD